VKRIIIMMLISIFLKKMYQQKKIQLLVGLNSWPHPYHPCSNPLHHCVSSATECNSWLILVICPALAFFWRENFLSSHDNLYCCEGGEGGKGLQCTVHTKKSVDTGEQILDNTYYWLHYLLWKTYCPGGYDSQCKTQLDNMGCFFYTKSRCVA
jgi:hypothetical protein